MKEFLLLHVVCIFFVLGIPDSNCKYKAKHIVSAYESLHIKSVPVIHPVPSPASEIAVNETKTHETKPTHGNKTHETKPTHGNKTHERKSREVKSEATVQLLKPEANKDAPVVNQTSEEKEKKVSPVEKEISQNETLTSNITGTANETSEEKEKKVSPVEKEMAKNETLTSNMTETGTANETQEGRSLLGGIVGTAVSAVNAVGQTMNNYGGDGSYIGRLGKSISGVAKSFAGPINFVLFTPRNPKVGIVFNVSTLHTTTYDPSQELIIIIHGYTMAGYYDNPSDNLINLLKIKDGLLAAGFTSNLVMIDWTSLSSDATYIFSAAATATVADEVSDLIIALVQNRFVPYYKWVRLIGHSLGAQTAGIVGLKVTEKTNGQRIGRVDAIDPAGPNFDSSSSLFQLGPDQADYVYVLHCNIKMFGSNKMRGTVDFFPNGGDDMPGCDEASIKADPAKFLRKKKKRDLQEITLAIQTHICNHQRCIDLYVEMLTEPITGCQCISWEYYQSRQCPCDTQQLPLQGFYSPEWIRGPYYATVNIKSKFQKYPPNYQSYLNYGAGPLDTPIQPVFVAPPHQEQRPGYMGMPYAPT